MDTLLRSPKKRLRMTQLRILVAEDDVLVAEDLREALEEMGHDVVAVVHRGEDVTRTARDKAVDLALLDIKMPGMLDGIDVGRRLRRELEIPVIFVTAYADDVTVRRAGASDPFGYLVKPVDPRALHTTIEIAAQRHARERLLREALREMEKEGFEGDDAPVHYRTLFRESPAAIAISALSSGRILDVNRRFQDLFGWDRHESVGETLDTLGIWSGEKDRDRIRELLESDGRVRRLRTSLRNREGDDLEVDLSAEILALGTDKALLTSFHDVTERAAAEVELQRMALYDTLTGLPNRNLFRDRLRHALDRARREGRGVGVLFVDLDGFKAVNDTLGHEAGDEILELVAQRILGAVRDEDTVARLGGDEFTVILEEDPSLSGAEAAARRIRAAMIPPFQAQGRTLSLTASVGVAVTRNGEIAAQDLVHSSDMAMYAAKQNGGDGQSVLLPDRDPSATRSLRLNDDLTRAVVTDEIGVSYQPVVAMDTGRIVGAEALVRWDHPDRGVLSPHILLASAEDAGLGPALGARVMDLACRQMAEWRDQVVVPDFVLSVNLSLSQLTAGGLGDEISRILREHDLPPNMLMVEISQGELLPALRILRGLRDRGIRVAVDDFGTGLSRFSHFRRLEVDAVKLDRSFVGRVGEEKADVAILRSAIVLAEGLGIQVVAEGVETGVQRNQLLSLGCTLGQGFFFSRPLQPRDFGELLTQSGTGVSPLL